MKFADALLLLFIGLKLAGLIEWSWLLVVSPLLISIVIAVVNIAYQEYQKKKFPEDLQDWKKQLKAEIKRRGGYHG